MITIKTLFPDWVIGNALFKTMGEMFTFEWEPTFDNENIDIEYFGLNGERGASRVVLSLLEKYTGRVLNENDVLVQDDTTQYVVTNQGIYQIAKMIYRRFGRKWNELYKTMFYDYNPIENYNMIEQGSDITKSNATSHSNDVNSQTSNNSNETISGVQGFNSTEFKDKQKDVSTGQIQSGTTGQNTSNSDIDTNVNHTLKRSGNIGVTTTQQMIMSQRDVLKFDFFDVVFKDVNKVLTTPTYEL